MTATTADPSLQAAFDECQAITRREARNFSYGIRLLRPDKRASLSAVYALARRVDDIGDGTLAPDAKRKALADLRADIDRLAESGNVVSGAAATTDDFARDPVLRAVRGASSLASPLPIGAFSELIDGVEMDIAMDTEGHRFASYSELDNYCRCVAGSIGRLCVAVFGATDPATSQQLADKLGIGLQQINILRDIREDLTNGRVYLPAELLDRHGVRLRLDDAGSLVVSGGFAAMVREAGARARRDYDDGIRLVAQLDRRSAACTLTMAGIYSRLLDAIVTRPQLVADRRLSLSGWSKAGIAVRALAGRAA